MNRTLRRILGIAAAAVGVAVIVVVVITMIDKARQANRPDGQASSANSSSPQAQAAARGLQQAGGQTASAVSVPSANPKIGKAEARQLFEEGMKLSGAGKYVVARTALSKALFSEQLEPAEADKARDELKHLADTTLFSKHVFAGDPFTFTYQLKSGDRLADMRSGRELRPGVVTANDLRVPADVILMANGVSAKDLQAGAKYKMIRGPFHAIVYRSLFAMDIYIQRDGCPKTFVRRVKVGLGKDGSTPLGGWVVSAKIGGRGTHAVWYPPASSGLRGPIRYGQKDYAFGEKGMWIRIDGIDNNTRHASGYGIHSTNAPSSIGQGSSLGCIRLADADIEFVFKILYEGHSTVVIRP